MYSFSCPTFVSIPSFLSFLFPFRSYFFLPSFLSFFFLFLPFLSSIFPSFIICFLLSFFLPYHLFPYPNIFPSFLQLLQHTFPHLRLLIFFFFFFVFFFCHSFTFIPFPLLSYIPSIYLFILPSLHPSPASLILFYPIYLPSIYSSFLPFHSLKLPIISLIFLFSLATVPSWESTKGVSYLGDESV